MFSVWSHPCFAKLPPIDFRALLRVRILLFVQTGGMQKARPKPHAPTLETRKEGASASAVDGGVGEALPHKSADLQVRLERLLYAYPPSRMHTGFVDLPHESTPTVLSQGFQTFRSQLVDPSTSL